MPCWTSGPIAQDVLLDIGSYRAGCPAGYRVLQGRMSCWTSGPIVQDVLLDIRSYRAGCPGGYSCPHSFYSRVKWLLTIFHITFLLFCKLKKSYPLSLLQLFHPSLVCKQKYEQPYYCSELPWCLIKHTCCLRHAGSND